ncbi:keto-deoxy-phosphogluconate aldolase, partial [Actinoplanes sp. NPDC048791]|uniref:bifunctional 4-hydroxy-2-oxoglutarate aldolase/2-dehydro-3-deoxy-phosphogluconate aldolase n=1 Tax=Actinoplanes sp. NPDC048791 TaxID=3154623 RepID=UPI0033EC74FA
MTVHETWQQLADHALVPVVVLDDPAAARPLGQALVDGGLPVAEVTLRTPEALKGIQELAGHGGLLVGAGTVLTPQQVDLAVEAGARSVVSPGLSRAVVERCQALGVPVLPGAVTATEVQAAIELGLEAVKFFPAATSGGPAAVA